MKVSYIYIRSGFRSYFVGGETAMSTSSSTSGKRLAGNVLISFSILYFFLVLQLLVIHIVVVCHLPMLGIVGIL